MKDRGKKELNGASTRFASSKMTSHSICDKKQITCGCGGQTRIVLETDRVADNLGRRSQFSDQVLILILFSDVAAMRDSMG
jgi:hypothetical protein